MTSKTKTATGVSRVESGVNINNLYKGVFRKIFDIFNDNVTDPKINTRSKWIYTTMPEKEIEDRSAYPIVISSVVDLSGMPLRTFGQRTAGTYLYIQIFSTNKEEVDTLSGYFAKALIDHEGDISSDNMGDMTISTNSGDFIRSKFPVYYRSTRVGFNVEEID